MTTRHNQTVAVIIPCYNEEATIRLLLDALVQQTYPLETLEVVIADGMSNDQTRQKINDFHALHPQIKLKIVDNIQKNIPSGLNRAIEASQGEFIVRLDAHSVPAPDYIERCVADLEMDLGDIVGGVWNIQPANRTWTARAIALAAAHPLGVGDAHYRLSAKAQQVDTVPFGAFRRELAYRVGLFDEGLLTNEDYEFNTRVRLGGGKIWLDPSIQSIYFARPNLMALARQYWRYGYWKAQMLKRYPQTIRWRQAIPPLFSASLMGLFLLGLFLPIAWNLLVLEIVIYSIALLVVGLHTTLVYKSISYLAALPIAIFTMHITWGTALLWGIIHPASNHSIKAK